MHATQTNGDSASYTFTGTGIDVLAETNSDEGGIDVYVDGIKVQSVSATGTSRLAQQVVASVSGLTRGQHTIKLVKTSGTWMQVDGFTVVPDAITPAHDITFQGLTFAYTTWTLPSTAGYIDNQAGVLWDAGSPRPDPHPRRSPGPPRLEHHLHRRSRSPTTAAPASISPTEPRTPLSPATGSTTPPAVRAWSRLPSNEIEISHGRVSWQTR